ncbi:MAG: ABC transporter permease [Clostridiales bacterium]|nr:ABC transporter permease [Clostridiales bacterium]
MLSITRRILSQILNDKRSLMILFLAPLLILTFLYFLLGDSGYVPKIAVYDIPDAMVTTLEESATITTVTTMPDKLDFLLENKIDALLWKDEAGIHMYLLDQNSKSAKSVKVLQNINVNKPEIIYEYSTNEENQLDSMSYVFLGVISFFFIFILSGISFVRERSEQTLERMLMSPISRTAIIGGYTLGYGLVSTLQSIIIFLFSVFVLRLNVLGNYFLCMLIMVIMSFAAVSVGALISIFANNELQLVQFIPIVIIPQIFFSGLIPLDTIPYGLGNLCYLTPIYYACKMLKDVMIYGHDLGTIYPWMLGILGIIALLFVTNTLCLKKYRKL